MYIRKLEEVERCGEEAFGESILGCSKRGISEVVLHGRDSNWPEKERTEVDISGENNVELHLGTSERAISYPTSL